MKHTLLVVFFLCANSAFSQYYYNFNLIPGNPGSVNTDNSESIGAGLDPLWNEIVSSGQASAVWSPQQAVPFAFNFNGSAVTDYKVSSSGVLTFDIAAGVPPAYGSIYSLPNVGVPDMSVVIGGLEGSGGNDVIVERTFGIVGSRQHWIFFVSYTPTGTSLYSYWSIVLEEGTDKIYIVDQRCNGPVALTLGVQVNASTAFQVAGTVTTQGQNLTSYEDNYYFEFIPGVRPSEDIAGIDVQLAPLLLLPSGPLTISGDLINFGANQVTAYDINYSVNGGAAVANAVTGIVINTLDVSSYTSPTQWSPPGVGVYTIDVWASNINGLPDQDTANDVVTITMDVVDTFTQRTPLLEMFTSSTCSPCVQGNIDLEALLAANPNEHTNLKYQMSWPGGGDPYFTAEGDTRKTYYTATGVPHLVIDGFGPVGVSQQSYDDAAARLAFIDIDATYSVVGKTVNIDVDVVPVADLGANNLTIHMAIFEWETYNNVGGNSETEFERVMKKMVPDASGQSVALLTTGATQVFSNSYTFNGSYRLPNNANDPIDHSIEHSIEEFSDLGVVVWVQNDDTKEVLQSAYAQQILLGVEENTNIGSIMVYPNPTSENATVMVHTMEAMNLEIELYNIQGARVHAEQFGLVKAGRQTFDLPTNSLNDGIYLVRILSGTSFQERKLIIAR